MLPAATRRSPLLLLSLTLALHAGLLLPLTAQRPTVERWIVALTTDADLSRLRSLVAGSGDLVDVAHVGPLRFAAIAPLPSTDREALRRRLLASPIVRYIEEDQALTPPPSPKPLPLLPSLAGADDDPLFAEQWYLRNEGSRTGSRRGADINALEAWSLATASDDVVIAVGEEGFDPSHPDLTGKHVDDSAQIARIGNGNGHGTMVTGLITAIHGNGIGLKGAMPGGRVLVVHGEYGTTLFATLKALEQVLAWNAAVFTNSWGLPQSSLQSMQEAYDLVARQGRQGRGVLIIVASGNDRRPWVSYPGWLDRFLCVGGTDHADERWRDANFGLELDLCAPSSDMLMTTPGGGYGVGSGTSFAAPLVAATAGMLFAFDTTLTADSVRALIELSCDRVGGYDYGQYRKHGLWSPHMGYGRLNAGRALRRAAGIDSVENRLIWPRGGEELPVEEPRTYRWEADVPSLLIATSQITGRSDTLARTTGTGTGEVAISPASSDLVVLTLRSSTDGSLLDSSTSPIAIRRSLYEVVIDSTTGWIDLDTMSLPPGTALQSFSGSAPPLALPFDLMLGSQRVWGVTPAGWGLGATLLDTTTAIPLSLPQPLLDPRGGSVGGLITLMAPGLKGYDSGRVVTTGLPGRRRVIFELIGTNPDSTLYGGEMLARLRRLRRQIEIDEEDGAITFHYSEPLELQGSRPGGQILRPIVALRTTEELVTPEGGLYRERIPAGSITFRPRVYTRPTTPPRSLTRRDRRDTSYGYDVLRYTLVTNRLATVDFRLTLDGLLDTIVTTQVTKSLPLLIPPLVSGMLRVGASGEGGELLRDSLPVIDHRYTIERLGEAIPSLRDDPRAAEVTFPDSVNETELPLPFSFPYFGRTYYRIIVDRRGVVSPFRSGPNQRYETIGVYPRYDEIGSRTPVRVRMGSGEVTIEWDSLTRFSIPGEATANARMRLRSDGTIDVELTGVGDGSVPYYTAPSIGIDGMLLRSPDFTLRADPRSDLPLPMYGYRFTPHPLPAAAPGAEGVVRGLRLHPNPANDRIMVEGRDRERLSLRIIDMRGVTLRRIEGVPPLTIDVASLPVGLYRFDFGKGTSLPLQIIR